LITVSDFVKLHSSEATQISAIDYAARSLHFTYDRMRYGAVNSDDMRKRLIHISVGIQIEWGFGALLDRRGVHYRTDGRTHWRKTDDAEFSLALGRVDLKGHHVYPSPDRDIPEWFLKVPALVPIDQLRRTDSPDIYVEAFLVAPAGNNSTSKRYVAILPRTWCNRWREARSVNVRAIDRLEPTTLILAGERADLAGQDKFASGDIQESISLASPQTSTTTSQQFSSLQYVAADSRPTSDIDLTISGDGSFLVEKQQWLDIWLEGPSVYICGWGFKSDYANGRILPEGSHHLVYTGRTKTGNYSLPVKELRAISELLRGQV